MEEFDKKSFAERVNAIALAEGMTIPELAERLEIPYKTIYNYTTARSEASASFLVTAYSKLGINPLWLLNGEGEMYRTSSEPTQPDDPFLCNLRSTFRQLEEHYRDLNSPPIQEKQR